eukprot:gb/GECG01006413.1/.p1 GENE.gb/GECG01006413.1/~~gb/GECG01006413.1/.p1  ORF type:complete len:692 (+),score=63.97 gb/GECG01006413.1/:1-2076(+)
MYVCAGMLPSNNPRSETDGGVTLPVRSGKTVPDWRDRRNAQPPQEYVPAGLGGEDSPASNHHNRSGTPPLSQPESGESINVLPGDESSRVDAPLLQKEMSLHNVDGGNADDDSFIPFPDKDRPTRESSAGPERTGSYVLLADDEEEGGRELARKLYGMSQAEYKMHQKERESISKLSRRQHVVGSLRTIHPQSRFKLLWDCFVAFLVGYTALTVPFEISFVKTRTPSLALFYTGIFVDFVFVVDILISFITGYWTQTNDLVMKPRWTMKNYAKTYLVTDIISVLPIDYFALTIGEKGFIDPPTNILVLRMMRLLRLCRLTKIFRYTKNYFAHVSPLRVHLTILGLSVFFFIHVDACLLFLISRLSNFPENSWVSLAGIRHLDVGSQYIWCLYTSISLMLCISYGSFVPQRTVEVFFISVSNLVGASIYAVVIATVTTLIMNMNKSGAEFMQYMDEMNLFMKDYNLPKDLRKRIRHYIQERFPSSRKFDEVSLLESLPKPLYRAIHINRLKSLTKSVPLLANTSEGFLESFIPELNTQFILADDMIVLEDEPLSGLYIIGQGECEFLRKQEPLLTLADGSFFGDVATLWNTREPFTVRAITNCYIHVIPEHRFWVLLKFFPDVEPIMKKVAKQRLERIGMQDVLDNQNTDAAFTSSSSMLNLDSLYKKVRRHQAQPDRLPANGHTEGSHQSV